MLQRANGIRVHLILLTKNTFHQIMKVLITYFNMKTTTKHHLLLRCPFLGGLSHPGGCWSWCPTTMWGSGVGARGMWGSGCAGDRDTRTAGASGCTSPTRPPPRAPVPSVEPPGCTCAGCHEDGAEADGGSGRLLEGDGCSPSSGWGRAPGGHSEQIPFLWDGR